MSPVEVHQLHGDRPTERPADQRRRYRIVGLGPPAFWLALGMAIAGAGWPWPL